MYFAMNKRSRWAEFSVVGFMRYRFQLVSGHLNSSILLFLSSYSLKVQTAITPMNYELYLVFYEKEINDRRKFSIFSICSAPPISRAGMVSIADL